MFCRKKGNANQHVPHWSSPQMLFSEEDVWVNFEFPALKLSCVKGRAGHHAVSVDLAAFRKLESAPEFLLRRANPEKEDRGK